MKFALFASLFSATLAMASGWNCTGEADYTAKIRNSTSSPRTPALFLVQDAGQVIVRATKNQIGKTNLSNGVRYTAANLDGDARYILYVNHKEGSDLPLEHGEEVDAKLIIQFEEGASQKFDMTCARYLKN